MCASIVRLTVRPSGDRQVPSRLALGKLIDCCERTDVTFQDYPLRPNLEGSSLLIRDLDTAQG